MKIKPMSIAEVLAVEEFLKQVTPGPWEEGVDYRNCGVNDGSDPTWQVPPEIQEGQCTACVDGQPLISEYINAEGHTRHIHKDDHRLDKPARWEDLSLEDQQWFETPEKFNAFEESCLSGDGACWHWITSAETRKVVVGSFSHTNGGVATHQTDAEFIARSREWVPRLLKTVKLLYSTQGEEFTFPEEEIPEIKETLDREGQIETVCVLDDFNKYVQGQRLVAPWGDWLYIAKVERYLNLVDYPQYEQLPEHQRRQIGALPIDILYLRKLWGPAIIH